MRASEEEEAADRGDDPQLLVPGHLLVLQDTLFPEGSHRLLGISLR